MTGESAIVVIDGGCVSDVLGVHSYDVFDWDNFNDDPIAYVEDFGGLDGEYFSIIRDSSPTLFDDIKGRYDDYKERAEDERRKDPFCDVPAVPNE